MLQSFCSSASSSTTLASGTPRTMAQTLRSSWATKEDNAIGYLSHVRCFVEQTTASRSRQKSHIGQGTESNHGLNENRLARSGFSTLQLTLEVSWKTPFSIAFNTKRHNLLTDVPKLIEGESTYPYNAEAHSMVSKLSMVQQ